MVRFVRLGHPLGSDKVENCGFLGSSQESYMWFKVTLVGQGHPIGSEMVEKWCLYGLITLFLFQIFGFNRLGLKCMDYLYMYGVRCIRLKGAFLKGLGHYLDVFCAYRHHRLWPLLWRVCNTWRMGIFYCRLVKIAIGHWMTSHRERCLIR